MTRCLSLVCFDLFDHIYHICGRRVMPFPFLLLVVVSCRVPTFCVSHKELQISDEWLARFDRKNKAVFFDSTSVVQHCHLLFNWRLSFGGIWAVLMSEGLQELIREAVGCLSSYAILLLNIDSSVTLLFETPSS